MAVAQVAPGYLLTGRLVVQSLAAPDILEQDTSPKLIADPSVRV